MNRRTFFILLTMFCIMSCNNSEKGKAYNTSKTDENEKVSVFPVTAFLKGQLKEIESSPVTLLMVKEREGSTDSAWISRDSLRTFVAPFLAYEIDSASMTPYFDSKSFYDDEQDEYVLDYTAKEENRRDLNLKQITVYVDAKENAVSAIYLVKEEQDKNNKVITQLTWRTNNSCNKNRIFQPAHGEPQVTHEKIFWNF